jgi:hypothetical protein
MDDNMATTDRQRSLNVTFNVQYLFCSLWCGTYWQIVSWIALSLRLEPFVLCHVNLVWKINTKFPISLQTLYIYIGRPICAYSVACLLAQEDLIVRKLTWVSHRPLWIRQNHKSAVHKKTIYLPKLIIFKYENNQRAVLYRLIYYSKSALHVSGDVFAHNQ